MFTRKALCGFSGVAAGILMMGAVAWACTGIETSAAREFTVTPSVVSVTHGSGVNLVAEGYCPNCTFGTDDDLHLDNVPWMGVSTTWDGQGSCTVADQDIGDTTINNPVVGSGPPLRPNTRPKGVYAACAGTNTQYLFALIAFV